METQTQTAEQPQFSTLGLHERLIRGLEDLKYEQPTPVQAQTIPAVLEGTDLMVGAETGSGKTAAFILPILHRLHTKPAPKSGTRALVLVPTRELARQVEKQCEKLARFTYIKSGMIIGGDSFKFQASIFRKNPEIIIATPGRLMEHLEKGTPDFKDLEVLVLDEADRMLDMGFGADVLTIAGRCPEARQTLLFSATMKQKGMQDMTEQVLQNPQTIILNTARDPHENIRQQIILADDLQHKDKLLDWLLNNETYEKAVVFTNTRVQANRLNGLVRYNKHRAAALHGEMTQDERNKVMQNFREGRINVLIATDVAARGLDVKGIDLVINLDMARNGDDYVHRIGRTGRAGEQGLAVTFISPPEWNLMVGIERYLKVKFERRAIEGLKGHYKGPKKVKASGKAAGRKKKPGGKKRQEELGKQRHRDKKNIGKRRTPAGKPQASGGENKTTDGNAPVRRKKPAAKLVDAGFEPMKRKKKD
ncbi:DEAD/DEAH box helicase [Endozoicomonadaceae bacterium StTr2]